VKRRERGSGKATCHSSIGRPDWRKLIVSALLETEKQKASAKIEVSEYCHYSMCVRCCTTKISEGKIWKAQLEKCLDLDNGHPASGQRTGFVRADTRGATCCAYCTDTII